MEAGKEWGGGEDAPPELALVPKRTKLPRKENGVQARNTYSCVTVDSHFVQWAVEDPGGH